MSVRARPPGALRWSRAWRPALGYCGGPKSSQKGPSCVGRPALWRPLAQIETPCTRPSPPDLRTLKGGGSVDVHTNVPALRPGRGPGTRSRTSLDETPPDRPASKAATSATTAAVCLPELNRALLWSSRLALALCSTLLLVLLGLTIWLVAEPTLAAQRLERPLVLSIWAASLLAMLAALVFVQLYVGPLLHRTQRVCNQLQLTVHSALRAARRERGLLVHVSHELRTPLNAMLGSIELLARTELEPAPRKHTRTLQLSAEALMALLNDVLDLTKLQAGMLELRREVCRVRRLLEDVGELFGARAQLANLRLICRMAPDVPSHVELDRQRVQQALANLVSNAVKFSDGGEVVIEAACLATTAEHVVLRFSVSDRGIGISEQDRARLFCAFSQLGGMAMRKRGGSGLGLSICKQLVETMGGSIGVESKVGEGSRFWFELSARVVSDVEAPAPPAPAPRGLLLRSETPPSRRTRPRLLVAEDDPINRAVLVGQLEELGYDADLVQDGRQALEVATTGSYPLLLLDCRMPELDGYETACRIRRHEGSMRRMVIVAVTADASAGQRARAVAAGMDDSLTKPIRLTALNEMLRRWCPSPEHELTPTAPSQRGVRAASAVNGASSAVTRLFLERAPAQLARIGRAVADAQPGELADAAHGLKGSCFAIGAQRLAELCGELEASPHAAATTFATLTHEYIRVATELRAPAMPPQGGARQVFDGRS